MAVKKGSAADIFEREIDAVIYEFGEEVRHAKADAVKIMFKRLVQTSPISTGSYLLSHRIGIGHPDDSITVRTTKARNRYAIQNAAMRRLTNKRLLQIDEDTAIFISNAIPWALNIEFEGWGYSDTGSTASGRSAPYYTYRKAIQFTEALLAAKY